MIYNDYYVINIKFNDQSQDVDPSEFSFSMSDSIYSLYNYATFELNDVTGLAQEYFITTEGARLELEYGDKEHSTKCPFIIKKDELAEIKTPGYLSGDVDIDLVNRWYGKQQIRSKAYQNKIDTIIAQIVGDGNFSGIDIESTGNYDYWYQPMITDAKFIQEALLPYAYSSSSETPFYAYTTNDNFFHLKSLKSMMNSTPIATIEIIAPTQTKERNVNMTHIVRRFHQSSDEHRALLSRDVFQIDRADGSLVEDEDGIDSYPAKGSKTIPIMNFNNEKTGYIDLGFTKESSGEQENKKGFKINSTKKSSIIDRFMVLQPLNTKFKSGGTVNLNIHVPSESGESISRHYKGKYIIENCEHIWNREESRGYTKLIVGRKYTENIRDNYILKSVLM